MKLLLSFGNRRQAFNSAQAARLQFLFLIASSLIVGNSKQFTIQSDLDEDITIIPAQTNTDQRRAQLAQANHDSLTIDKNLYSLKQQAASSDPIDPFSVTFEDYLKEASKSFAHHLLQETTNEGGLTSTTSAGSIATQPSAPATTQGTTTTSSIGAQDEPISQPNFIIEEEDNLIKPKESPNIDQFFPNSKGHNSHGATVQQPNERPNAEPEERAEVVEPNEIKLQFTWSQSPTNMCSKSCGRGFRLFHYSCIDLKYDVRVSDELCIESNLIKPNATSGEACNEIDCPPQWTSVEFRDGSSANHLYKRAQCMMVDKRGIPIYLDDSRCNELNDIQTVLASEDFSRSQSSASAGSGLAAESVESLGFHGSIAAAINVLGSLLRRNDDGSRFEDGDGGYRINNLHQRHHEEFLLPGYDTQLPKGYMIQIKSRGRNKQPQVKIIKAKRHGRSNRSGARKVVREF